MHENALRPSANFKKMARKSIQAILLFVITYLILVSAAVGLTVLSAFAGLMLIAAKPMFLTIMLGGGLICFGVLILIFLVKFIFKVNKIDRSYLTQVTKAEQPELFKMIDEIVLSVQTDFPKKVYLSNEVNAAVFYDSNFWSMFFPVRKNLMIGFGLINTTTADELRAILAHEFGHFSQKSMKVGIYVYQFNKIIYDMLYENESYDKVTRGIANASSYIGIFVLISDKIIGLMQQILVHVYQVLSESYSKLSHEMEFHADAVAAVTVGSKPLADSLLRMQLASRSIDIIYNYYERKIDDCVISANIFPQQILVMNFLAQRNKLPFENGFPQVSIGYYNRFNKSKISFSNQYSSHPETDERIKRLNDLGIPVAKPYHEMANSLLVDQEKIAEKFTAQMFRHAVYREQPSVQQLSDFETDFLKENDQNSYPDIFNGYFDYRNPYHQFNVDSFDLPTIPSELSVEEFFDDTNLSLMYELKALESDLATINNIDSQVINVKTFNYDGKKYSLADCRAMIDYLKSEISKKNGQLALLDVKVFEYFRFLAKENQIEVTFKSLSIKYKQVAEEFTVQENAYFDLANATRFMHTSASKEMIKRKMVVVKKEEKKFKDCLIAIVNDDAYASLITKEAKTVLTEYLKHDYKYFGADLYFDEELKDLFFAMNFFGGVISERHFLTKKELLAFSAKLTNPVFN